MEEVEADAGFDPYVAPVRLTSVQLARMFDISNQDRAQVLADLRKMGLKPTGRIEKGLVRLYDRDDFSAFLKEYRVSGIPSDAPRIPPEKLPGATAPTSMTTQRGNSTGSQESHEPDEVDDPDGAADHVHDPQAGSESRSESDERLVTPTEAAEILGKRVKAPNIWISGLKKKTPLVPRGRRGRMFVYRLGDIRRYDAIE